MHAVICIPPSTCLLWWPHIDLASLSFAVPVIIGRSCFSLWSSCLLVELGVICPSLLATITPTQCVRTLLTRLMFPFLSPHRAAPPEISSVSAGHSTGQMWPRWPLTSTKPTPRISSAAWTWKRPSTVLILCPMTCAVTLPKTFWSEWKSLSNIWNLLSLLCCFVELLWN